VGGIGECNANLHGQRVAEDDHIESPVFLHGERATCAAAHGLGSDGSQNCCAGLDEKFVVADNQDRSHDLSPFRWPDAHEKTNNGKIHMSACMTLKKQK